MAQCNWDPAKHNGKPCPVHGASGTENNTGHKLRINGGKYQVKYSDSSDYEDTDKETFDHLRETASQDFDENVEDDFGFDEDEGIEENSITKGLTNQGKKLIVDAREAGFGNNYDPMTGSISLSDEDLDNKKDAIKQWLNEHPEYKLVEDQIGGKWLTTDYENGEKELFLDEDEPKGEVTDEEISEALADFEWQITDSTTVGQYAQETADKLGCSKEQVLKVIRQEDPNISEDERMSKLAGLDDEEPEKKELPNDVKDWLERNKDAYEYEIEAPEGDDTIYFKTTRKQDGEEVQYSWNKRTGITDHTHNQHFGKIDDVDKGSKKEKYQSILKKAFNALDEKDAMDIIFSNTEVHKAFQKVQRENPNDSFWYQLSLLPDELYGE